MQARLVWVAFAWLAALVGLAAVLYGSGSSRPRPLAANALARSINDAQPMAGRRWQWTATSATSARREMVVQVEAFDVRQARQIATSIVEPRRGQFDDILVYVHHVGGSAALAARRVEWTPRGGYEEVVYSTR
ncbi:MAG TPA: hypothetical protein VGQ37_02245 [Vicinamibacterales bacterium]|jgi:hypothetical protein|nr:hypothetical protein [Vicinamibacterales bacterium]